MPPFEWRRASLLASALLLASEARAQCAPERLLAVDAVELVGGREVKGEPALAVTRGAFMYLFSTEANLRAFEAAPEKFEIQLGGACARMGPLSGMGRSDIFAVHDGHIYVFASPQCRTRFLAGAETLLEADDPPVEGGPGVGTRGRELIELAIRAAGGREKLDGLSAFRQTIERQVESRGGNVETSKSLAVVFPDQLRIEDTWDTSRFGEVVVGGAGHFVGGDEARGALVPSQVRAVKRIANRHPLVILKAAGQPGFAAAARGAGTVNGRNVELVAVSFDGTTTTLGIDPQTGEIQLIGYTGRGPALVLGAIEQTVTEHRTVDGISLPWAWTTRFDGQPAQDLDRTVTRLEVNPALDRNLFAAPVRP